jgi:hypothetical protein
MEKSIKMEEEKIINGNCWVACFDILGFKEEILGFEKAYGVGQLDGFANVIYKEALETLNENTKDLQGHIYTCWGSDTFVFYTPDDSKQSFNVISALAFIFFCSRIRRSPSYMMRGALGTGQFYADKQNNIFIGSALIDAYTYAEKQDWIGFVVTPSAEKKIDDIESDLKILSHTLLYQFIQYDVPVKDKESKKERLFAAKIQSDLVIKGYFQPKRKGTPQKEWTKKYENTRSFFEQHP